MYEVVLGSDLESVRLRPMLLKRFELELLKVAPKSGQIVRIDEFLEIPLFHIF